MRVAVITYFSLQNYGAVLQAVSLNRFLRSRGHEADVIDYRPRQYRRYMAKSLIRAVVDHPVGWWASPERQRLRMLTSYVEAMGVLGKPRCRSHRELARALRSYDAVITGSDEIWNFSNFMGWDSAFLLECEGFPDIPRISYAASASSFQPSHDQIADMQGALSKFSRILVRDERTAELVKGMGLAARKVLDPVFIGDLAPALFHHPRPYLAMAGGMNEDQRRTAVALARKFGLDTVGCGYRYPEADASRVDLSPDEWMGAIKGAECVVSTLFHATAYAIKWGRPFYVFRTPGKEQKITALLDLAGDPGRLIEPGFEPEGEELVSLGADVSSKVSEAVEESRSLLSEALGS